MIKIAFNKQIIDRCDSKIDFRAKFNQLCEKFDKWYRIEGMA